MPKRKSALHFNKTNRKNKASKPMRFIIYSITLIILLLNFLFPFFFYTGVLDQKTTITASSVVLSLLFSFAVFSYMSYKGKNHKQIIYELGLSKNKLTLHNIGLGILLFFVVLGLSIIISLFSAVTNIQLPTNVQRTLSGLPLYFFIFTFLIAPINEEILFRGFFVPRIGIIISAIIFGLLHLSYLSISEFAAAFIFGLIAGYIFKKRMSLYPSIVAHILVNFATVMSLIYTGMLIHLL